MYFEDLSPYTYAIPKDVPEGAREDMGFDLDTSANVFNVGWLENGYAFKKGPTSWKFRWKLRRLAKDLKNDFFFGVHTCDLCEVSERTACGHGEIHVAGPEGVTLVAPALIIHYIAKHEYRPPQNFIDAVLTTGWFWPGAVVQVLR